MSSLPISDIQVMDEDSATGVVLDTFGDIKQKLDIPFVPSIHRTLAGSPSALKGTWAALRNVALESSLPQSLTSMILYAVSCANECEYCDAVHKVTCKSIGIDDETLKNLSVNITELAPERVQTIVAFGVKCATRPQELVAADYESLREAGLTEQEVVEVVSIAALANYLDTVADGLKLQVDDVFKEILGLS